MPVPNSVQAAINTQIKNELQAHYNYLGMAVHFDATPYRGFAKWMRLQATEEYGHAMKLYDFLSDRNGRVELATLDAPKTTYDAHPLDAFRSSFANEQLVTGQINDLYELAQKEKDFATLQFLAWFLQEQVEEESTVLLMIERLELVGNDPAGLLRLDDEAGRRVAEAPAPASGGGK